MMAYMPKSCRGWHRLLLVTLMVLALSFPVLAEQTASGAQVPPDEAAKTVTLELKATDLRDVLQLLARVGEVNIVADDGVKGEVTLSLKDVPFNEALDYVTRVAGYTFRRVNGTILVSNAERFADLEAPPPPPVIRTAIIGLKNGNPSDIKGALGVVVPEGRVGIEPRTKSLIIRGTDEEIAASEALVARLDVSVPINVEPESTVVIPVRFVDPEDIKKSLSLTVEDKKVLTHKQSRSLIVRGTKEQLAQVKLMVESLDKPDGTPVATSEPQTTEVFTLRFANPEEVQTALAAVVPGDNVRVEKRTGNIIVTGTSTEIAAARSLLAKLDQGVAQIYLEARLEEISSDGLQELGFDWPKEYDMSDGGSSGEDFLSSIVVTDWSVRLRALEKNGKANLLASPKILAVDGEEANIHIGDSVPVTVYEIQEGVRVAKIEYIETGIILKVTPKINGAGVISAKITPEVSNVTGWSDNGYPQIRKRQAETVLRMTDGQTVAIGGLRIEQEVKTKEGLPVLGSIPLLGKLFAVDKVDKKTNELVIFITAKVVKDGEASPIAPLMARPATTPTTK